MAHVTILQGARLSAAHSYSDARPEAGWTGTSVLVVVM